MNQWDHVKIFYIFDFRSTMIRELKLDRCNDYKQKKKYFCGKLFQSKDELADICGNYQIYGGYIGCRRGEVTDGSNHRWSPRLC